tara:strand:+ start:1262 stop:1810 length:549 start_codon:yes stop_codon:yes gene_type:complete
MLRIEFCKRSIFTVISFLIKPLKLNSKEINTLSIGSKSPNFTLLGFIKNEKSSKLWIKDDFLGNWLIIYFYPKDFTNGCTLEARSFESEIHSFKKLKTNIIGISSDSLDKHESFCIHEDLSFPLLSDPNGTVSKAYNSWLEPYSKRKTFLIDPKGEIKFIWESVRPFKHGKVVLEKLRSLQI